MRLLLDTHTLLWWLYDDPKLSGDARQLIATADSSLWVSAVSAYEVFYKQGARDMPPMTERLLSQSLRHAGIAQLDISFEHALVAGRLPGPIKDPFDRILIAQAMVEGMILVTRDNEIPEYPIQVFWKSKLKS
jgi:PIN domain nuclease of toxin-antitoxin system